MNKQIIVRLRQTGWTAEFVNDPQVVELFGTSELPTPFTRLAAQADVVEHLRRINPGTEIIVSQ